MVDNQGADALPAVVTNFQSTTYSFTQITLNGNGHVTFVDTDDTLILDESDISGDLSSQLCTYGTLNATNVIFFLLFHHLGNHHHWIWTLLPWQRTFDTCC